MIYSQSGSAGGIGFAIPADIALRVTDQIVQHGRVIRGWLGASLAPQSIPQGPEGLLVTAVQSGGPAHQAGLQPGDYIVSVNQVSASNAYVIIDVIEHTPPGSPLDLEVVRQQQRFRAQAIAGELPDPV